MARPFLWKTIDAPMGAIEAYEHSKGYTLIKIFLKPVDTLPVWELRKTDGSIIALKGGTQRDIKIIPKRWASETLKKYEETLKDIQKRLNDTKPPQIEPKTFVNKKL